MFPIEWSDKPVTKKDLLKTLATIALFVWLSDSEGVEKGAKLLREKVAGLIAPKPEEPTKP